MTAPRVEVSRIIDAPPEAVYRVVSDYRVEHPQILPRPYFESLTIEEGGQGAGTVYRLVMNVLGTKTNLRMRVTEPQPGRVIQEEDAVAGVCTTFTITPVDGSARSQVQIVTEWRPKGGFVGFMERLVNPAITRYIYKKELGLLAAHLR